MANDPSNTDDTLLPSKAPPPGPPGAEQEADTLLVQPNSAAPTQAGSGSQPEVGPPQSDVGGVAGYQIITELGRGGMGVVYKARQTKLKRLVALKMILAGSHAGPAERERFRREAETVARLQHPNIVQIYEIGERNEMPYFSMEFIEGKTLQQKLNGTPQPTRLAALLIEILAHTIHFAHHHGVVHRDLKPGNILLADMSGNESQSGDADVMELQRAFGTPKVMDFGLAKCLDAEGAQTRTGDLLGTPSYMSPEQAAGKAREIGPSTDVYALGAILYELLTGRPPFRTATPLDTLWQVLNETPLPPGSLRPKLPRDLERICMKCLEKDPGKRYASALELAEDLRRHLNGEPVHARPPGPLEQLWTWCRRNPLPTSLLFALTFGAAFGLWHLSRLSESLVRLSAIDSANQQVEMFEELNHYYADLLNHLDKIEGSSPKATPAPLSTLLPAPATLTIDLGKQISEHSKLGMRVRLYSNYPFQKRKETGDWGPRDDFEREALAELERDPETPVVRFEEYQGRASLRYAAGRVMKAECISCHNNHTENTKHDWKVGDLRGVLEIIRPLDEDAQRIQEGLHSTFLLAGLLGLALLLLSGLIFLMTNRRRNSMRS